MPKKLKEEEVVTEEMIQEATQELKQPLDEKKPTSKAFEAVLNDFNENEGWIHVKFKSYDKGNTVKIGKFRPNEFDKDEIARIYGGGVYYYDLRDSMGRRIATDEERYADNINKAKQPVDSGLSQALDLIKDLTGEIAKLKQEISKPQTPPIDIEKIEQSSDKKYDLMIQMMKQQSEQTMEMMKAIITSQSQQAQRPQSDTMKDFLQMLQAVKNLVPQTPQVSQEKPSMAEAVELASVLADLKDSGNVPANQSLADVVKTFLTDGSLANVISMLKPKPMIPAMQSNSTGVNPTKQIPVATSNNQPTHQPQSEQAEPEQSDNVMLTFFKQYESTLFDMKVNGQTSEYVAETICNLTNLQPEFKTIAYMFFNDAKVACDKLYNVATLFKQDKQFLQQVCDYIHSYFYDIEQEDIEQEDNNTQEETNNDEPIDNTQTN